MSLEDNNSSSDSGDGLSGSGDKPKTDSSKLFFTPADNMVYVSQDGGKTVENNHRPNIEYDFCANILNNSDLPSGAFFVLFKIEGDDGSSKEISFGQDSGLDSGANVLASVHYGSFPNQFIHYTLSASIYASSSPETAIRTGQTGIVINTSSTGNTTESSTGGTDPGSTEDPGPEAPNSSSTENSSSGNSSSENSSSEISSSDNSSSENSSSENNSSESSPSDPSSSDSNN